MQLHYSVSNYSLRVAKVTATIKKFRSLLLLLNLLAVTISLYSQLAPVNPPTGGFRIEGNLKAGTPATGEGDWLAGTSGGYVINNDGSVVDANKTRLVKDPYHSSTDDVFNGSSFSENPNSWKWIAATSANKCDINNGMYHISSDENQKWIMMGGDRVVNTGTSYIDFEFYQGRLTKNANGTFSSVSASNSSLATTNGRTPGDFVLSMEYTNGGAVAAVHYYRWELSAGAYRYVEYSIPSGSSGPLAFGATNSTSVEVPFGAFGATSYAPYLFVEAAVNVDAILNAINPCEQISVKTVFIKTKASDSYNAALKDFITPIEVNFVFGHETFSYPAGPYYNCGILTPTYTGTGSFSASPSSGLSMNAGTGVINLGASTPGTYVITYSYQAGGGCTQPATDTITIVPLPAPNTLSNQTRCSGTATAAVSFSSGISPVSFTWINDQPSIGLAASGTGNIPSFIANNGGNTPVVATITYMPNYTTFGSNCAGPSRSFTITVNPLPASASVSITEPSICGSSTGTITVTSPSGTGYEYNNNGGNWQSGTSFSGITAGSGYNILVKDANGCISQASSSCNTPAVVRKEAPINENAPQAKSAPVASVTTISTSPTEGITVKAYPNPFHTTVNFEVILKTGGYGSLELFTVWGQKIKTIYQGHIPAGLNYYNMSLPPGTYHQLFFIMHVGQQRVAGKLIQLPQ